LAHALVPWFDRVQRDLTWRRTRDPYAIWVSEIMLQQTRVETVERYFTRFVARFPDVETLAGADEQEVLAAWSGLGYYRRARLLHRGARHVADQWQGRIPTEVAGLRTIPGVGRYTAGAIASIAFDRPVALVDGNVARVLSRVQAIEHADEQGADAAEHWALAGAIMQHGSPRVLAQALMELGATVCTPKSPQCLLCPVRSHCVAHRQGKTAVIPAPRKRVAQPLERWAALAVVSRRRLLLIRRPLDALLGGMWCLPLVPIDGAGRADPNHVQVLLGAELQMDAPLGAVRHVFTHRIWELEPRLCPAPRRPPLPGIEPARQAWIAVGERPPGGLPSLTRKLLVRIGYPPATV
jgi:A/G-specific adenine glycosylase